MPIKKLTYFSGRGRGEIIRLIFASVNEQFEDFRVSTEWPELKATMKYGQMPVLKLENGLEMNESLAITRYLARLNNLYGINDWEMYLVDRAIDTVYDLFSKAEKIAYECKADEKEVLTKELKEKHIPTILGNLTKYIEECGGEFLAGSNPTVADLALIVTLDILPNTKSQYPKLFNSYNKTADTFPGLSQYLSTSKPDPFCIL